MAAVMSLGKAPSKLTTRDLVGAKVIKWNKKMELEKQREYNRREQKNVW